MVLHEIFGMTLLLHVRTRRQILSALDNFHVRRPDHGGEAPLLGHGLQV